MARYRNYEEDYMPRRPSNTPLWVMTFLLLPCVIVFLLVIYPDLPRMSIPSLVLPASFPTASIPRATPPPYRAPAQAAPAVNVQQSIDQYNATAQAQWQAAQPAQPMQPVVVPNTDTTNDSAPVVTEDKPVDRQPAGANVPTAEPLMPLSTDSQIGEKRVIINPQRDHKCLHGQVWADGCRNPTPVK